MDWTCNLHRRHDFGDIINYFPPEAKIISHVRSTMFPVSCLQADGCCIPVQCDDNSRTEMVKTRSDDFY